MLKYLEHGSRTTFDQKIIGGLFEEYASDSDEEDKINRVMDTEEEKKEFFSISLPPDPELRKKQFNKNIDLCTTPQDFEPLRNLYKNSHNISSIACLSHSNTPNNKTLTSTHGKLKSKRTLKNINSPLAELTEKKISTFMKKHTQNYSNDSKKF